MYSSPPPSLPSAPAPPRRRAMSRSHTPVPRPQPVFGAGSIRQVKKFHSYDDPHRLTTLLFFAAAKLPPRNRAANSTHLSQPRRRRDFFTTFLDNSEMFYRKVVDNRARPPQE